MEADRTIIDRIKAVINLEKGTINALKDCLSTVRRGGTVSILGVYGIPYDNFPLGQIFVKALPLNADKRLYTTI